jgi:hypothetical protein
VGGRKESHDGVAGSEEDVFVAMTADNLKDPNVARSGRTAAARGRIRTK